MFVSKPGVFTKESFIAGEEGQTYILAAFIHIGV